MVALLVKNLPANAGHVGLIPGLGGSPGEGNGNSLQYSCLGNPMDRGTWWATVHGVTKELDMTQHLNNNKIDSSVQLLSRVQLFETPWSAARQASLSITNSQSLLKLMSIESVMPSNHLILCCPFSSHRQSFPASVFSNESVLRIRWPKYWSFSFSTSPFNEYSGLISFRIDWLAN